MRVIVACVGLLMLQSAGGHVAATQKPPAPTPAFHPTKQVVRIDVIAHDARGRVLDNLKPADFELRDDGVAQTLDSVRFLRPDPEEGRLIALFLDEYHVDAGLTSRVQEAVTRFINESVSPQDMLVVMKPLDSLLKIQLSHDREAALAAAKSFEGRVGDYTPRNAYERNFMAGAPERIEAARAQVALSAINALAVHFNHYADRRKTLIVISEGMGRGERRRGLEYLPTIETIVRSAQRNNVAIYPLNPGAAAANAEWVSALAGATAGVATSADVDEGLRRAMADASGYYLLTYETEGPDDGRFHPVQVQVKKPGAQVRTRAGYFAPSPDDTLRAALLEQINNPKPPPPLEPAPHVSPLIRPWFGTTRGADGKTRVTFVWEPAPRQLGARNQHVPIRVVLKALAADDSVLFEGPVAPTSPGLIEESVGVPSHAVFDMPPGHLRVRIAIQDAAEQTLDTDIRTVNIRDTRGGVVIGTPEVLRARNAREFRTLDTDQAVPAATREFSRSERLRIRFLAYGPPNAPLTVSARLLSRMGPMRELPIAMLDSGARELDVPLAGLATGEYLIELNAKAAGTDVKDVITFHVTT
ncbi:MAG TPA: VWA domain-containing protein [Vicinamibacterales bacterium]|jgi:VWFA-related protein